MVSSRHANFVRAHLAARHGRDFDAVDERMMERYGSGVPVDEQIVGVHDEEHDSGFKDLDHTHGAHGEVRRVGPR